MKFALREIARIIVSALRDTGNKEQDAFFEALDKITKELRKELRKGGGG